MGYKWFVLIWLVSIAATLALTLWKLLGRATYCRGNEQCGCAGMTFIGQLSWFAVPWPMFIGLVALGWPYVWAVLRYEIYKGL